MCVRVCVHVCVCVRVHVCVCMCVRVCVCVYDITFVVCLGRDELMTVYKNLTSNGKLVS